MQEHLDDTLFANQTSSILILISVTLIIAGIFKGFFGHRLAGCCDGAFNAGAKPHPTHALALLAIPILFTNFTQFIRSQHRADSMKTYWPMAFIILLSIFIISFFITLSHWLTKNHHRCGHSHYSAEWIDRMEITPWPVLFYSNRS